MNTIIHTINNENKEVDNKDPTFQVGYHVRISKYKKCLLKTLLQFGLKKF